MVGALKALVASLQASPFLAGVSVAFGEEEVPDQGQTLPFVVIVPKGGPWDGPGYAQGLDPNVEMIWTTKEEIDVHMWAESLQPNAQPLDHAAEVEDLRQKVLSAFQDQRAQQNFDGSVASGLFWKPTAGRWELMDGAASRLGRAYVMTFMAEISVPMAAPVLATVTSTTTNTTLTNAQHVG